ncbi:MAG: hypothetical protein ABEH43_11790 [Flavobacteriales bacterium]
MSMKGVNQKYIRRHGDDFNVYRDGEKSHEIRGKQEKDEEKIILLPDADIKEGDELKNQTTEEKIVIEGIEKISQGDNVGKIHAYYK